MPLEKIKDLLQSSDTAELSKAVNQSNHFEIARLLHKLSKEEKIKVFSELDTESKRQDLLYETDLDSRLEIQGSLDQEYLARLLDEMPEDEATDLLKEHAEDTRRELLSRMEFADAEVIKNLITYSEETAGGLMTPRFNKVSPEQTATDILVHLKAEINHDRSPYFYVVKDNGELLGYFELRDLLNVAASAQASTFTRTDIACVQLHETCEKIANLMDHEHLSAIPVVDENKKILGIVTFDDVIRMMQDIASEDIFTMVGTAKVDPFAKRVRGKITARAPWLLTTFLGGMISATIMALFETTIAEFATIIFFIPFVIGLAGNVGIQGATVIVRGLATGDIQSDNLLTVVRSELLVGVSNGLIFGVLCGGFIATVASPLLHSTPILGIVVGAGIIMAVTVAALIGSLAPSIFLRMGIDPAIAAGPVVTVSNDILGILIYLTTAKIFLSASQVAG
ncbi:MAG: magnesium transporter [Nitrospinae bacterium CG11_big_fil_rev_8_21_14_0_20_45_15]|nr:MAG: magnesium transporter [Nitrospinae bacterium CG11_big_fil_rev_8_21_14_0_20_45_15]